MELSYLCPFKVVGYSTKKSPQNVSIITLRPSYLLKNDKQQKLREVALRIEKQITDAIVSGIKPGL